MLHGRHGCGQYVHETIAANLLGELTESLRVSKDAAGEANAAAGARPQNGDELVFSLVSHEAHALLALGCRGGRCRSGSWCHCDSW